MTASTDMRRPHHHLRASAHACPDCETNPLIIIFQHQPAADEAPGESLTEDRLDEFVATIDTNPPF